MQDYDYKVHNEKVQKVWQSYHEGNPIRIPMIIGINPRYILLDPKYNKKKITFKEYFENPEIMWDVQLDFCDFVAHNIYADHEMGTPARGWTVNVDFQNTFDSPWLGCPMVYPKGEVPATRPFLMDDNKNELLHRGIPDPFSGIMNTAKEHYENFSEKIQKGAAYKGVDVTSINKSVVNGMGTFTLACSLRGTQEFCIDLFEDTQYALDMLELITQAKIMRTKAWRKYLGLKEKSSSIWFADDCIALLSNDMYKEFVLPFHKKLFDELTDGTEGNQIHLCGDASHHFLTIRDELNVNEFDTGFPISHGKIVKELGSDVRVHGGPHVGLLLAGSIKDVAIETKRIIDEVKPHSKKFILRDANNVAPFTPLCNIEAMYKTVNEDGFF